MPGSPLTVDLALLVRRNVALEPDETALRRQPLAQFLGVDIGQVRGEEFGRFVDVDEPARLGVERGYAHVGRQDLAVAVEDVRTRGGDRVAGHEAMYGVLLATAKHDEPHRDHGIDRGESENGEADARPRLGAAIDVPAVEQLADQPLPPRDFGASALAGRPAARNVSAVALIVAALQLRRRDCRAGRRAWRRVRDWFRRPKRSGRAEGAGSSRFSIMPPIGSVLAVTSCGARSGR